MTRASVPRAIALRERMERGLRDVTHAGMDSVQGALPCLCTTVGSYKRDLLHRLGQPLGPARTSLGKAEVGAWQAPTVDRSDEPAKPLHELQEALGGGNARACSGIEDELV